MSFNRTKYDPEATMVRWKQSIKPGDYMTMTEAQEISFDQSCSPYVYIENKTVTAPDGKKIPYKDILGNSMDETENNFEKIFEGQEDKIIVQELYDLKTYVKQFFDNPNEMLKSKTELKRGKTIADRAHIESRLQNRNVPLNRSNLQNDNWAKGGNQGVSKPCNFADFLNKKIPEDSIYNKSLIKHTGNTVYQNSRISHPSFHYKEMSTLEKNLTPFLHVDFQKAVTQDSKSFRRGKENMFYRFGTNTKQLIKDTYDMLDYTKPDTKEKFWFDKKNQIRLNYKDVPDHLKPVYRNGTCDDTCRNGNLNGTFTTGQENCKKHCVHNSYEKNTCMNKGRAECTKIKNTLNYKSRKRNDKEDKLRELIYNKRKNLTS
jgi:hypothetical protein